MTALSPGETDVEIFDWGNKAKKGEKGKQKTVKNNAKTLSGLLAYMLKNIMLKG